MTKEERRKYVISQLNSLPNAFQYVEVTNYIKNLEEENKKYKEIIDKAMLYINSTRYSDITGLEKHPIKEFWFIEELLDILKEVE